MDNETRFCENCGTKVDEECMFCPECGAKTPYQNQGPSLNQANVHYETHYPEGNEFNSQVYRSQCNSYETHGYTPKKRGPNTVIIIVSVVAGILILSLGGYFGIKALLGKMPQKNTQKEILSEDVFEVEEERGFQTAKIETEQQEPEIENSVPVESPTGTMEVEEPEVPQESTIEQVPQYIEDPKVYLPEPNMKYSFEYHYVDGVSGTMDVVTGVIPGFSLVTTVDLEENTEAFAQHFVDGPDGIYVFGDYALNEDSSLWLPYNAGIGYTFDDHGIKTTIKEFGVSCDLGYRTLDNCCMMEVNFEEANFLYNYYIYPGIGTVRIVDMQSGSDVIKLVGETRLSEEEAQNIVEKYSPRAMEFIGN